MKFVFPPGFNPKPTLKGDGLTLRPLNEGDVEGLYEAASDPKIWAGHPATDRYKKSVFRTYFKSLLNIGGCLIAFIDGDDIPIGCSSYYTDTNANHRLSIGFTFLTVNHWGGATNRKFKRLMLNHAYRHSSEVWFHIAPSNIRSQKATKKLGAVLTHTDKLDLGGGMIDWQCYCLTQETWKQNDATY